MTLCLASTVYGSSYSFAHITQESSTDDVEAAIKSLSNAIDEIGQSKYNTIEFATDTSLDDILLEITNDDSFAIHLSNEIEKSIGGNKSYRDSQTMVSELLAQTFQELPVIYPYTQQMQWDGLSDIKHIQSYSEVCNQNSLHFKNAITTRDSFTDKAKVVYEHIDFCSIFSDKLKTIKRGSFLDYLDQFSHALNTLNQSYHKISNDSNKNEDDLVIIRTVSADLGRSLACTRQGNQKPHFDFPVIGCEGEFETVDCEYHLKLNFDDQNIRLPTGYYNRVYFGLKFCEKTNRKQIKLAYIGEHWPPRTKH
jgi:hypothetical protein